MSQIDSGKLIILKENQDEYCVECGIKNCSMHHASDNKSDKAWQNPVPRKKKLSEVERLKQSQFYH